MNDRITGDATAGTAEELDRRVRKLVGDLCPLGPREPGLEDRLMEDLGYDSMALVELALLVESEFELPPISDQRAMDVVTVGDIVELVRSVRP